MNLTFVRTPGSANNQSCFITADCFFLEISAEETGSVFLVNVTHEKQTSESVLLRDIINDKRWTELQRHLWGLCSAYIPCKDITLPVVEYLRTSDMYFFRRREVGDPPRLARYGKCSRRTIFVNQYAISQCSGPLLEDQLHCYTVDLEGCLTEGVVLEKIYWTNLEVLHKILPILRTEALFKHIFTSFIRNITTTQKQFAQKMMFRRDIHVIPSPDLSILECQVKLPREREFFYIVFRLAPINEISVKVGGVVDNADVNLNDVAYEVFSRVWSIPVTIRALVKQLLCLSERNVVVAAAGDGNSGNGDHQNDVVLMQIDCDRSLHLSTDSNCAAHSSVSIPDGGPNLLDLFKKPKVWRELIPPRRCAGRRDQRSRQQMAPPLAQQCCASAAGQLPAPVAAMAGAAPFGKVGPNLKSRHFSSTSETLTELDELCQLSSSCAEGNGHQSEHVSACGDSAVADGGEQKSSIQDTIDSVLGSVRFPGSMAETPMSRSSDSTGDVFDYETRSTTTAGMSIDQGGRSLSSSVCCADDLSIAAASASAPTLDVDFWPPAGGVERLDVRGALLNRGMRRRRRCRKAFANTGDRALDMVLKEMRKAERLVRGASSTRRPRRSRLATATASFTADMREVASKGSSSGGKDEQRKSLKLAANANASGGAGAATLNTWTQPSSSVFRSLSDAAGESCSSRSSSPPPQLVKPASKRKNSLDVVIGKLMDKVGTSPTKLDPSSDVPDSAGDKQRHLYGFCFSPTASQQQKSGTTAASVSASEFTIHKRGDCSTTTAMATSTGELSDAPEGGIKLVIKKGVIKLKSARHGRGAGAGRFVETGAPSARPRVSSPASAGDRLAASKFELLKQKMQARKIKRQSSTEKSRQRGPRSGALAAVSKTATNRSKLSTVGSSSSGVAELPSVFPGAEVATATTTSANATTTASVAVAPLTVVEKRMADGPPMALVVNDGRASPAGILRMKPPLLAVQQVPPPCVGGSSKPLIRRSRPVPLPLPPRSLVATGPHFAGPPAVELALPTGPAVPRYVRRTLLPNPPLQTASSPRPPPPQPLLELNKHHQQQMLVHSTTQQRPTKQELLNPMTNQISPKSASPDPTGLVIDDNLNTTAAISSPQKNAEEVDVLSPGLRIAVDEGDETKGPTTHSSSTT
ncbi:putative mediator of RNA polymerase II transcription subunit 1 [Trichinella spiralis]|uniref:putative mediator of RNA polymerase II transcription subunit 1 n=1 Tax=Trichinella spiralis TaxID=6334 RepID=UPI0001EFD9FB|nr:putative mediator of RNA polymerase II transcription subunit 1 [Trichinella spiralis]